MKKFLIISYFIFIFLFNAGAVFAADGEKVKPSKIPCVPSLPCIQETTQESGGGEIRKFVLETFAGSFMKGFLGLVAATSVILIIVGGLQMVFALGNEEALKHGKTTLTWAIAGLVIAILAAAIVRIVTTLPFQPAARTAVVFASSHEAKIDEILPPDVISGGGTTNPLPSGHFKYEIIPQAIKILLALAGTVTFGVFVYAGIMLIIAQGNEEDITKFKNILIWTIVGLIFITTAYGLVSGVMKLVFE